MALNHLHLHVKNRPIAQEFYRSWFGMTVSRHGECLIFLDDGKGFDLALMEDPAPLALPPWFHFGFRLDSNRAVADLHDRMSRAGIAIVKPPYQDETFSSFRCADPDGYTIEVYWEAGAAER